ncbi:MAG: thioredoxin family protein [Desulfovibrio sp.]|nr:thioredoxin family protein [Desulfovibrio sp.]
MNLKKNHPLFFSASPTHGLLCLLTALTLFFSLVGPADALELAPVRIEFARDGGRIIAVVLTDIPSGYHAYAHEPENSGRAALVDFSRADGRSLPVFYPAGMARRDYYAPKTIVSVYEGPTAFFIALPDAETGMPYSLELSLLLCSAKNCLPVRQHHTGLVPDALPDIENVPWYGQWNAIESAARIPAREGGRATPPSLTPAADNNPSEEKPVFQFTPQYADMALEISGLGKALLVGIVAGLLLNAMPCVLPVLVLKMSGFFMLAGANDKENLRRLREHNLCFAAGVMSLFTVLALFLGLADMIWGQLFQNQTILLFLIIIVFLLGLSMLGVFTLPVLDFKFAAKTRNPRLRFYLTGFLSTLLATPCSGPLLGGVLGWAFTQALPVLVIVFWAVGLGMALPYLLLCIRPDIIRIMPKPGPWMLHFEHIVGFLLLGTALYLFSILPPGKYVQVLSALLLTAFCAWLWGQNSGAAPLRRRAAGAVCLAILALSAFLALRPEPPLPQWQPFSPEYFSSKLGEKNILLEFTADWCPNCKFLETAVLTDERLRTWRKRFNLELIRVDMTHDNAFAGELLEKLGGKSLPLTALFPAGDKASSPLVLRDVYSARYIEESIRRVFAETP